MTLRTAFIINAVTIGITLLVGTDFTPQAKTDVFPSSVEVPTTLLVKTPANA